MYFFMFLVPGPIIENPFDNAIKSVENGNRSHLRFQKKKEFFFVRSILVQKNPKLVHFSLQEAHQLILFSLVRSFVETVAFIQRDSTFHSCLRLCGEEDLNQIKG